MLVLVLIGILIPATVVDIAVVRCRLAVYLRSIVIPSLLLLLWLLLLVVTIPTRPLPLRVGRRRQRPEPSLHLRKLVLILSILRHPEIRDQRRSQST